MSMERKSRDVKGFGDEIPNKSSSNPEIQRNFFDKRQYSNFCSCAVEIFGRIALASNGWQAATSS